MRKEDTIQFIIDRPDATKETALTVRTSREVNGIDPTSDIGTQALIEAEDRIDQAVAGMDDVIRLVRQL